MSHEIYNNYKQVFFDSDLFINTYTKKSTYFTDRYINPGHKAIITFF